VVGRRNVIVIDLVTPVSAILGISGMLNRIHHSQELDMALVKALFCVGLPAKAVEFTAWNRIRTCWRAAEKHRSITRLNLG
jgi:hypothetical protein